MADDGFTRLNREFYDADPHAYFRDRLTLLAIRASRSDAVDSVIAEGIHWGQLKIGTPPVQSPDAAASSVEADGDDAHGAVKEEARRDRYVVTESQILLHHASEALLRMFLAHAGRPECPWIETAALLDFREFRRLVAELAEPVWQQERIDAVAEVFLGVIPTDPPAEWIDQRDAAVRLIRLLAKRLSDDANLYNSVKHGLTALAGTGSISFVAQDGTAVTGADGVNVVFLEREGKSKEGFTWFQKTQFVNPEQTVWLINLVIHQMEALWTVARWRYLKIAPEGLHLVTNDALDTFRDRFQLGGPLTSMRVAVARQEPSA